MRWVIDSGRRYNFTKPFYNPAFDIGQGMKMECIKKCLVMAIVALLIAMLAIAPAAAQLVQTGGFTRTYQQNVAGGTFVPPQAEVSETFYSYPGISAFGPYPGAGYAYDYGVGMTPCGYGPFGGFTYL